MFIYMCICMLMCSSMHVIWRPVVNTEITMVTFSLYLLSKILSLNLELMISATLVGQQDPRIQQLCIPSMGTGEMAFIWLLVIQTQHTQTHTQPCLYSKYLTHWVSFFSPRFSCRETWGPRIVMIFHRYSCDTSVIYINIFWVEHFPTKPLCFPFGHVSSGNGPLTSSSRKKQPCPIFQKVT